MKRPVDEMTVSMKRPVDEVTRYRVEEMTHYHMVLGIFLVAKQMNFNSYPIQ